MLRLHSCPDPLPQLKGIPEVKQRTKLAELLAAGDASAMQTPPVLTSAQEVGVGKEDMMRLVQVAMSTFLLHVEARVFAYVGEVGAYTRVCSCSCGRMRASAVVWDLGEAVAPRSGAARAAASRACVCVVGAGVLHHRPVR